MVRGLTRLSLAAFAACALSAGPLVAQAQQQQKQQQTPPAAQQPALPPGQPSALPGQQPATTKPAPPKANPKEEADYKAFFGLPGTDTGAIISKGDAFLKNYPESRYRAAVDAKMAMAYQAEGDAAKMFATAEKSVELNPDEVSALSLLAGTLPRRLDPADPGAQAEMQKVQLYAQHAIQLLSTMSKPANLTDEQFTRSKNAYLAMCHSGLGLLSYYRNDVPQAIAELQQATQLGQDPVDYFLLGVVYEAGGRFSDAVGAFTQCSAASGGAMKDRCKGRLEDAKKKAAASPAPAK
jgi:tetratricopeptide (TPR) repeat protein